jgi:hypothetical protein
MICVSPRAPTGDSAPDPWWVYEMGIGRMETALVEDLRRFARAER